MQKAKLLKIPRVQGPDNFKEIKEENKKKMKQDYEDMKNGVKEETENFKLSQDIEDARKKFIEEGYVEYEKPDEIYNKDFEGKKCRYILKDGLVRKGGRIVRFDINDITGDKFVFIRPFVPTSISFGNGWSVQLKNIKYFYVADIKKREGKKKVYDEDTIFNFLNSIPKGEHKNKTQLFELLKNKYQEDKDNLNITRMHVDKYYKEYLINQKSTEPLFQGSQ